MGTVPDPVRSAKLLLVAASEEKDGQGDLHSTKHQRKQANIERSSNGISYTRVEPAGVCLFDLNCTVASDLQRGEQLCGHDTSQPGMFLPGSSNQPAEEPLAYTESDNNSEQKGSDHSPVQARTVTRTSATGQAADMMPATYNADPQCMQTDLPRSLAQADCAVTNDTAELQELNCPSPGNTIKGCESSHHSSLANTPQRVHGKKEKVAEVTDPSFSLPGRDFEAIPDLQIRPQVYSEAEIRAANDVNSCPTFKTALAQSNEALLQSGCKGSQPVCTAEMEKTGPVLSQLSRFREAGTMTVLPEGMAQESVNRTWRDAEVQAVASTESKSASTSPGMLAAFLKENPPLEAKEQWHIIYQSDDGVTQSALVDDVASLKKPTWCPGMRTEVYGPAAEMDTVTAQLATLQKPPGEPPETICAVPSGNTTPACPCPQAARNIQGTPADWAEAQAVSLTRDSAGLSQLSPGAAVLLKAKPVYQIMVHTSNQPAACQQAGDGESHPSPSAAIPRASNSFPHQVNDWESKKSPGHGSVHHGTEQAETLCSAAGSSTGSHPVQVQTADEVQIGPVNVKIERHPKKEEELMLLDPVCGVNTGTGAAAAASVKAHMPGTVKTEQGKMPEETSLAMKPSSPSLQAASTPVLNVNSTQDTQRLGTPTASPHQVSKTSETRKKLALGPASAPPLPHLGEKKKKPMVATEAKVQVQPSKHVRDVVWDEQGMTWEVYGASLDPESLGIAIQNHLQRQIREHEKLIRAQSTQNRKSVSSDTSSNKKLKGRQHNVFQSMLQNLRRPNCCVRPAPSSVLD